MRSRAVNPGFTGCTICLFVTASAHSSWLWSRALNFQAQDQHASQDGYSSLSKLVLLFLNSYLGVRYIEAVALLQWEVWRHSTHDPAAFVIISIMFSRWRIFCRKWFTRPGWRETRCWTTTTATTSTVTSSSLRETRMGKSGQHPSWPKRSIRLIICQRQVWNGFHLGFKSHNKNYGGAVAEWLKALLLREENKQNPIDLRFAPWPGESKKNSLSC